MASTRSCGGNFLIGAVGVRPTLSQKPVVCETQMALGRDWDWRDHRWEQNFAALLNFKRQTGHCRVPVLYKKGDLKLGWWVVTQRRNRREMSDERRARLNKIGFVWRAPLPYRPTGHGARISAPNLLQPRA